MILCKNLPVDGIFIIRANISLFLVLFVFKEKACISYVDPEQTLRSVASDLALHSGPMSL